MKCSSVRENLFDYIDGALTGSDLREFEDHLASCSECCDALESLKQLDARLQQEVPAYMESIEPSPAFLNRLRSLELETESSPGRISQIFDSVFAIFQEHRTAFGAGMAVLIMIAVGLSIPTITQDSEDDAEQLIAEATPPDWRTELAPQSPSEEAIEMSEQSDDMNKVFGGGAPAPAATPAPELPPATEEPSYSHIWDAADDEVLTSTAEPVPPPLSATPPPIAEAEDTVSLDSGGSAGDGVSAVEEPMEDPATIIALNDDEVLAVIEGTFHIELLDVITEGDYACDGPTVAITLNEKNPPGNLIYVCVDVENDKVIEIKVLDK